MGIKPLGYRAWTGRLRSAAFRSWPIARTGITLVFRRKVLRFFLLLSLLGFLFHAGMIYLLASVEGRMGQRMPPEIRNTFPFTGTGGAYRQFILLQSAVVMMLLALAGGLLVGNDFRSNAVPFYLARPITRFDYFLGKFLSAFGLTALITLIPALVLFLEYGAFTESFDYYRQNLRLMAAIAGYGALVSAVPSLILLGLAALLKRTIPLILAWAGIFVFLPLAATAVRGIYNNAGFPDPWAFSLADLWTDMYWISSVLFQAREETAAKAWPYAAVVLGGAALASFAVFWRQLSKAEVVR